MKPTGWALLCLVFSGCITSEYDISSKQQFSTVFAPNLLALSPVSYWRLGELSGTTLLDSAPPPHIDGTNHGARLGNQGAIIGDSNRSVFFTGANGVYANVPDNGEFSLTRAWDHFSDCLTPSGCAGGWGYSSSPARDGDAPAWERQLGPSFTGINDPYFTEEPIGGDYYPAANIMTGNKRAVFQQGLPVALRDGDMQIRATWWERARGGALQPIALIARRQDANNYIRAELVEQNSHQLDIRLVLTTNGVDTVIATRTNIGTYNGEWWYLRFQFESNIVRARAWKKDTGQDVSTWQVQGEYANVQTGTIAVRASNLNSSAKPNFRVTDFWAQTLGLTVSLFVNPQLAQPGLGGEYVNFGGKVTRYDGFIKDGNSEYEFRYHPIAGSNGGQLKGYIFNLSGHLGAGQNVDNIVTNGSCPTCPLGLWYHLGLEFDSGDFLDPHAGVTMYVNGTLDKDGMNNTVPLRVPGAGSQYNGAEHCSASSQALIQPLPGLPGVCEDNHCKRWSDGVDDSCWTITPQCGDAEIRVGTVEMESWFNGAIDEVAIFDRKLSQTDVVGLFGSAL